MNQSSEQHAADIAEGLIPIDTDFTGATLVARYRQLREMRDAAEAELKSVSGDLSKFIIDHGGIALTLGGDVVARRTVGTNHTIDSNKLRKEHPDIHAQYLRTTAYVRVTVTKVKDEA